ncbi:MULTISPECIES: arsenite efflux transporter metallochaperone ArsD [Achromobacter]|uniref:arsenite efflux transporter metallochaperone ArsD n=1 Tax=Achromobacter TaxID=222 RepID=UPI001492987F|nr:MULTISPECIES: arsenite efflux transporter metallochaperone ArsD [Achromobacter]QVQ29645.1 arsenite efflux transporter metallochaperone ArsD [Achromobacter deleyi]UIP23825.1 arsenite efflux transporter metallochaperone ArsD [Achromobacter deleyi]
MKTIRIFDPALCCSTGVCGTDIDQALVTCAADIDWAKRQGARIERLNLAQQPLEFAQNAVVSAFLARSGADSLPLTLIDDEIALAGRYPTRSELSRWAGINGESTSKGQSTCCGGNRSC